MNKIFELFIIYLCKNQNFCNITFEFISILKAHEEFLKFKELWNKKSENMFINNLL